jgi:hypothetical protein
MGVCGCKEISLSPFKAIPIEVVPAKLKVQVPSKEKQQIIIDFSSTLKAHYSANNRPVPLLHLHDNSLFKHRMQLSQPCSTQFKAVIGHECSVTASHLA